MKVQNSASSSPHYSPDRLKFRTIRAFTLVELLVVIAIMALIMGLAASAFRGGLNAASPTEAADLVSAAVLSARSQALTLRTGSRIAIDAEAVPGKPDRYLRRVSLFRKVVTPTGDIWEPVGKAITLPEFTFFSTAYSSGYIEVASTAAEPKRYVYEFDSAGRLIAPAGNAEARLVFVAGTMDSSGTLQTPAAMLPKRNGFIIRRAGRVAFFQTPAQMPPTPS